MIDHDTNTSASFTQYVDSDDITAQILKQENEALKAELALREEEYNREREEMYKYEEEMKENEETIKRHVEELVEKLNTMEKDKYSIEDEFEQLQKNRQELENTSNSTIEDLKNQLKELEAEYKHKTEMLLIWLIQMYVVINKK